MAEKNVLSPEEIEALLNTVDDTPEGEAPDEAAEAASGVKAARKKKKAEPSEKTKKSSKNTEAEESPVSEADDPANENDIEILHFTGQERIVKGKLPVLDRIYDRTIRSFAAEIYHLTGRDFEIIQEPLLIKSHRDFMEGLPNPSLMSIYKFKPLRGKGIILFDSVFVYDLVDYYFGGSSQFFAQKDRTDFTATELRVMDAVSKKLIVNLAQAWKAILPLDISKFSDEINPQLVHIAEPEEMLLSARFNLNFGKETGSFYFILPYSMIEPIKDQLELGAARPEDEIDPNWIKLLKEELMEVELTVSSSMAQVKSTLGSVLSWQVGDFIPMEMKEIVTLDVEGTPGFSATLGTANDKRALKIIKNISY